MACKFNLSYTPIYCRLIIIGTDQNIKSILKVLWFGSVQTMASYVAGI